MLNDLVSMSMTSLVLSPESYCKARWTRWMVKLVVSNASLMSLTYVSLVRLVQPLIVKGLAQCQIGQRSVQVVCQLELEHGYDQRSVLIK
jgi:hypothetical protein